MPFAVTENIFSHDIAGNDAAGNKGVDIIMGAQSPRVRHMVTRTCGRPGSDG